MKIFTPFIILSIAVSGAFAAASKSSSCPVKTEFNLSVPYSAVTPDSIYIVWNSGRQFDKSVSDYFVYVNGKKQPVSAVEQSKVTNHYASSFKKSFYEYFTEERTGLKMVQTDTTFYKLENLKPNKEYKIQAVAVDSEGKELFSSNEISAKTAKKSSKILNVTKFGASAESKNNAPAIQKAIDACPVNGTVLIPEGTFVSGSIHLKSNMTLRIDGELKGSPDAKDYDFGFLLYEYYTDKRYYGLINADKAQNIRICGTGSVDGSGWKYEDIKTGMDSLKPLFYTESGDPNFEKSESEADSSLNLPLFFHSSKNNVLEDGVLAASCAITSGFEDEAEAYATRSTTVILRNCSSIFIEGLTFTNPANHMINILDSSDISVTGTTILTFDGNNGDGIGLICSQNAVIWNNFIDTGDDSIVFSSGVGKSAYSSGEKGSCNAQIFGNFIHHGHGGVAFGSHTALGIYDVTVEDNIFSHTDAPFRFKSAPANGGEVFNISFKNNALAENQQAITMSTNYSDKGTISKYGAADKIAVFHDISVENITSFGTSRNGIFITAKEGDFHHSIKIKDVTFSEAGRDGVPGKGSGYAWFVLENLKNCSFENIKVLSWDPSAEEESRKLWGKTSGLVDVKFE